jgi:hypothetical protein
MLLNSRSESPALWAHAHGTLRALPARVFFVLLAAQSHPWASTVPVNEFDTRSFECASDG